MMTVAEVIFAVSMAWLGLASLGLLVMFIRYHVRQALQRRELARAAHVIVSAKPISDLMAPPTWTVTFFSGAVAIELHNDVPEERLVAAHCFLRLSRLGWSRPEVRA